ncbi:MAG: MFS transporter [Acutalibacteraceae bacterium]
MDGKKIERKILDLIGVKGTFKDSVIPMMNYSCANIATSGAGYVISLYFSKFLTDTAHLDQKTQVSLILLIVPFWDAIIDPFLGIIIDRTRSKRGRHRPYILAGIPLFCISFVMLWNAFGIVSNTKPMLATAYYIFAYILYKTAFSMIDVAHVSMLPELAKSYDLRTQYNSVGYIFNSFGMFPSFIFFSVVMAITGFSKGFTSEFKKPMLFIAVTLSVLYGLVLFQTYRKTSEPSSLDMKLEKVDYRYLFTEYKNVFKNRSFREYFFASIAYNISYGFYNASLIYYIDDLAHLFSFYAVFTTIAGIFEASAFPLNYALTMKFGKKKCGFITTPLMIGGFAACLFMKPSPGSGAGHVLSIVLLMITAVLFPFGKSGIGYACQNILPDVTDVDEVITGKRREGVIVTCNSLVKQAMAGVINGLAMYIMGSFGLATGQVVEEWEKAHPGMLYEQTDKALFGVRLCVAIIPIVFAIISLIMFKRFRMEKKEHELIRAALAAKHRYGSVILTEEEKNVIESISGQKFESTWLGKDNDTEKGKALEKDENGEYIILTILEKEAAELKAAKATQKEA